jgi:hypothetical protein
LSNSKTEKFNKSSTLIDKLALAAKEAKAEIRLLEAEKQKNVRQEYSLVNTDSILKKGMETLKKIKRSQTSMLSSRSSQTPGKTSRTSLTSFSSSDTCGDDSDAHTSTLHSSPSQDTALSPKKRSSASLPSFEPLDSKRPIQNRNISFGNVLERPSISPLERWESLNIFICQYILCTYIHIYVYAYADICICIYIYMYSYSYTYICMNIYVYIYICMYVCTYMHMHIYVYVYVHIIFTHICIHIYIFVYVYIYIYMYI